MLILVSNLPFCSVPTVEQDNQLGIKKPDTAAPPTGNSARETPRHETSLHPTGGSCLGGLAKVEGGISCRLYSPVIFLKH